VIGWWLYGALWLGVAGWFGVAAYQLETALDALPQLEKRRCDCWVCRAFG
jgi:hypothetical protein